MTFQGGPQPLTPTYPPKEVPVDPITGEPIEPTQFIIIGIRGAKTFRVGQFPITLVGIPTLIAGADPLRRSIVLRNIGANDIYIGPDTSLAASNGYRIASTDAPLILETSDEIWGLVLVTSTIAWLAEIDAD